MILESSPSEEKIGELLGDLFLEWGRQRKLHGDKSLEAGVAYEAISGVVRLLGLFEYQRRSIAKETV